MKSAFKIYNALWLKAVGGEGYDKAEWMELGQLMFPEHPSVKPKEPVVINVKLIDELNEAKRKIEIATSTLRMIAEAHEGCEDWLCEGKMALITLRQIGEDKPPLRMERPSCRPYQEG